ncbi:MAG: GAF domain-containing protein [Candidatus Tectomicrobia bacterium]|nr:GAF domain-containing protein [Candidatus Tectomicrobia bacterium]
MRTKEMEYFTVFREISKVITSTLEPKEVLKSIVEHVTEATGAKGSSLRLLDEKRYTLELVASHGLSDTYLRKGPVDAEKSAAETLQGKVVPVFDATTDPRVEYPKEAKAEGIASILSVPLIVREKVIGVLRIYTDTPHVFMEEEIEFVSALADQSAIAIENARLHAQVKESYTTLMNDVYHWFEFRERQASP